MRDTERHTRTGGRPALVTGLAMLLLLIPAVLWLRPAPDTPRQGIDFRAITSDPGYEALPSLASDANRVAYVNQLSPGTAQERIVYEG